MPASRRTENTCWYEKDNKKHGDRSISFGRLYIDRFLLSWGPWTDRHGADGHKTKTWRSVRFHIWGRMEGSMAPRGGSCVISLFLFVRSIKKNRTAQSPKSHSPCSCRKRHSEEKTSSWISFNTPLGVLHKRIISTWFLVAFRVT